MRYLAGDGAAYMTGQMLVLDGGGADAVPGAPTRGGDRLKLRVLMEPRHGATYDRILAMAQATERPGFDAFFRSDHYLGIDSSDPDYLPTDSWTTLGGLARETTQVKLGTLMTAGTYRMPAVLAMAVASVDQMSGGRIILGIGTGWYEREHQAFGIPFPPMGSASIAWRRRCRSSPGCGTTPPGETFSFEGRSGSSTSARTSPRSCSGRARRSHRRDRPAANAAGGRPLRRRVQQRRRHGMRASASRTSGGSARRSAGTRRPCDCRPPTR